MGKTGISHLVVVLGLVLCTCQFTVAQNKDTSQNPEAKAYYEQAVQRYMSNDWFPLAEDIRAFQRFSARLTNNQRKDIIYIRNTAPLHRPGWWDNCKRTSNISFKAKIWNRQFVANYMPTDSLGAQASVGVQDNKLQVIVTWKPSMVDNPAKIEGWLADRHGLTEAHLADSIIWHELGHNYISINLPLRHVVELYQNHMLLYVHVQEFYADMTALYHAGPKGRIATMLIRAAGLHYNRQEDPHTRAAQAIGALILTDVLANPQKWPSFNLPTEVPSEDIERNTIIHMYDNLSPSWTLEEDKQLRELVRKFIMTKGESVLRSRGQVALPNRMVFMLMTSEDRQHQARRDKWVASQLERHIKAGLIKPVEPVEQDDKDGQRIVIPF